MSTGQQLFWQSTGEPSAAATHNTPPPLDTGYGGEGGVCEGCCVATVRVEFFEAYFVIVLNGVLVGGWKPGTGHREH